MTILCWIWISMMLLMNVSVGYDYHFDVIQLTACCIVHAMLFLSHSRTTTRFPFFFLSFSLSLFFFLSSFHFFNHSTCFVADLLLSCWSFYLFCCWFVAVLSVWQLFLLLMVKLSNTSGTSTLVCQNRYSMYNFEHAHIGFMLHLSWLPHLKDQRLSSTPWG